MDATAILWTIGFPLLLFFIGVGTGTVFAMTDAESVGFWVARLCFIAAGLDLIGFSFYWLLETNLAMPWRVGLGALVGLLAVPTLLVSLVWIDASAQRLSTKLVPGNFPDPPLPQAAQGAPVPQDALKVFFGSNVTWSTKMPHTVLVMAGEQMIAIDREANSNNLLVSVLRIFDDRNNIIARIDADGFWVENGTRKKRPDPHTLVVFDHNDSEVLRIAFLNKSAVSITGVFRHRSIARALVVTPASVSDGNMTMTGGLFGECSADIVVTNTGYMLGGGWP